MYRDEEELNEVAMNIIVHAGDARNIIMKGIEYAKSKNFDEANDCIVEAKHLINKAHISQTKVIQDYANGDDINPNLLFIHAQDTLMTIKTEVNIYSELIDILKMFFSD